MGINNQYIEVAVGGVSNRGSICKADKLSKYLRPNLELYRSLYRLDDSAIDHFDANKTIRSYSGTFELDRLTFDIDKGTNSKDKVMKDIRYFLHLLEDKGADPELYRIWFSGRGFHVEIPDLYGFGVAKDIPEKVKRTIHKDFGKLADNIYDYARLIRVGYSYNMKSKLYKTPITVEETHKLSYEEICELSKTFIRKDFKNDVIKDAEHIWTSNIVSLSTQVTVEEIPKPSSSKYNGHVTCVQKMADNIVEGRRHNLLLRMVSAWHRKGIDVNGCYALASAYIPSLEHHELVRMVDYVVEKEYRYSCSDPVMAEFCDTKCMFYKRKDYTLDVRSPDDMSKRFADFVSMDLSKTSFDLKDVYSIPYNYTFYPGELAVLIGDTGLGKTAWIQNLIVSTPLKCLFLSLEVHDHLIYRRFMQVANGLQKEEVNELHSIEANGDLRSAVAAIEHINIMTASPEIGSMKQLISEVSPKIVVIDTIDGIRVDYNNDPFKKMEHVINGLKELAVQENIIVIGISHISKGATYEDRLTVHSAKGNSVIEQKADKVLGIMGDRDGTRRIIKSLKSRDENRFQLAFDFDYRTFRFKEITNA
tara:strand:- start:1777 stop:3546 length:1770 start_codon:yes stop_codon:yes gene_type:complete